MPETRAITQDIRPLEILILNLMPTKVVTETQFARLLGNTPLQVHLEFLHTRSHVATSRRSTCSRSTRRSTRSETAAMTV